MKFTKSFRTDQITALFLKIVLLLFALHMATLVVMMNFENKTVLKFMSVFYFDAERNFPSTYSALAILFCAYLLWEISCLEIEKSGRKSKYWRFLSFIFLFLAFDEYTSIHENAGHILKLFTDKVFPFHGWYIPVLIVFGLIGMFFLKFFYQLPKNTKLHFFYSIVIFIVGAVVCDILSAIVLVNFEEGLKKDLLIYTLVTLEELFEMIGIIIFINALLIYLVSNLKKINLKYKIRKYKLKPAASVEVNSEVIV